MRSILLASLLVACHRAPAAIPAPENVVRDAPEMGYVLVSRGAWLRSWPDDEAAGARAEVLNGKPTDEGNLEQVWVARRIAEDGHWVEIENLSWTEREAHCYGSVSGLGAVKLRLFVRDTELVPVTVREIAQDYEDGSGVMLRAGVALGPVGKDFQIGVDGTHPVVGLDRDDVGTSYLTPTGPLDGDVVEDELQELPNGEFTVDGGSVDLPASVYGRALVEEGPDADHLLATVHLGCSAYRGLVEKSAYGGIGRGEPGWGTISAQSTDLPEIRAGARLTWPDGSPAGEAMYQFQVRWGAVGEGCFKIPLAEDPDSDWTGAEDVFLTLCAAEADWIAGFGG